MTEDRENQQTYHHEKLEKLALEQGLAIVVQKNEAADVVSRSNNNSICEKLYSSAEFAPRCAEFCGAAYKNAMWAGGKISVKCYAGLHYDAVPLALGEEHKPLVAIVGRTFAKSEEYKTAAERAVSGDWKQFSADQMFENVHLANSEREIEQTTKKLEKLVKKETDYFIRIAEIGEDEKTAAEEILPEAAQTDDLSKMIAEFHKGNQPEAVILEKPIEENAEESEESAAWRSVFGSLLELEYKNAYSAILNFLASHHSLSNLVWLENAGDELRPISALGDFAGQPLEIALSAADARLQNAIDKETSLELRERATSEAGNQPKTINLFPIAVGGEVISALIVGDDLSDEKTKRYIARFVQNVSPELEILRLREKVERQSRTTKAIHQLNDILKEIDEDRFWISAAQISAELMRAERGSLLVLNEDGEEFTVKAAVGSRADAIKNENSQELGKRIAQKVLQSGKPLIVKDIAQENIAPAPAEWKYKTDSFISYPIMIGGRKIGVLNVTDTIDGEIYDETDLELLNTISPQLAVALDRTSLKRQAVELRQISITDPLTGLLNRRYLEERLSEEVNRSQRHGYPTSFMMIDVDEFKSYNDKFSHPEGDKALQIVGQCLKATLRAADVAARYGGEEFSILLPQTNINEAFVIAERIRRKVESTEFPNRKVTISIGISACSSENCDMKRLMATADKALYQAKEKGRNNVQIFRESGSASA